MIGLIRASLFVVNILIIVMIVTESKFSATRDTEIDRLLKKLNKPALKSIKSPDGDIIDCVHMKNHPIYDNPLFKNHTIQMKPSSYPEGWDSLSSNTEKQWSTVTQLWTTVGRCPKNSIPIRRTSKEDILRAESIERYGKKYPKNFPKSTHEYAVINAQGKFNGARALINVWKPYVQTEGEFSLSQIWVVAHHPNSPVNAIEAGWHVFPSHYNDSEPHNFIYWTTDGYQKTGCYNLACEGFIPINRNFAIGVPIMNVSTLDGEQSVLPTTIWKDNRTGHWWLKFSYHTLVGYWPSSLFNRLGDGATNLEFGGEIINLNKNSKHTKTKMGSGRFPEEGYRKASYFKKVEIINEGGFPQQLMGGYQIVTKKSCYNLNLFINPIKETYFYYGGPGQNFYCR